MNLFYSLSSDNITKLWISWTTGNPILGFKGPMNTDPEFINESLQYPNPYKHSYSRKIQKIIINVGRGEKDDPFIGS